MPADAIEDLNSPPVTPEELIVASGFLNAQKQKSFDIRLQQISQREGFEVAYLSHRRHPAVEAVFYVPTERIPAVDLRLRSRFYRLFSGSGFRVPKERLFVRCRCSVVRMVCVPEWE